MSTRTNQSRSVKTKKGKTTARSKPKKKVSSGLKTTKKKVTIQRSVTNTKKTASVDKQQDTDQAGAGSDQDSTARKPEQVPRTKLGRWVPGQSGNPAGRQKGSNGNIATVKGRAHGLTKLPTPGRGGVCGVVCPA